MWVASGNRSSELAEAIKPKISGFASSPPHRSSSPSPDKKASVPPRNPHCRTRPVFLPG